MRMTRVERECWAQAYAHARDCGMSGQEARQEAQDEVDRLRERLL